MKNYRFQSNDKNEDIQQTVFKRLLQQNLEKITWIIQTKIQTNDFISQQIRKKTDEISNQQIFFSKNCDVLLQNVVLLNIEKIQNSSFAFLKIVPNKFLQQIKNQIDEENPSKIKAKIDKFNKKIASNQFSLIKFKEITKSNFGEMFKNIKIKADEFAKKFNKIMMEIMNFQEKLTKIKTFIEFLKVINKTLILIIPC